MPIGDGLQLGVKDGVVELCATIVDPHTDTPEPFLESVSSRLFDHQYTVMTDPTILDPDDIGVASCLISRDPIPDTLKNGLTSLGFVPQEMDAGGRPERSLFSAFSRGKQRQGLDKWRTTYLRAPDVSERFGELESSLLDDAPRDGWWPDVMESGTRALADAARTHFKILVAPSLKGLADVERALLKEQSTKKGRLVLHPAAVRALTCFVAHSFFVEARGTEWSDDETSDSPLEVRARSGAVVRTDPEFRVVRFIVRGNKELLSTYVEGVLGTRG